MTAARVMPSRIPASVGGVSSWPLRDQEDVVAGAFGHFALVVEHQGFDAAGLHPLDLGQDVVQVVQRLDARVQCGRVIAHRAGRDDLQALLVVLLGIEREVVGDDDHLRVRAQVGIEAQRALAARDDQADIAVLDLVQCQRVVDRLGHLVAG